MEFKPVRITPLEGQKNMASYCSSCGTKVGIGNFCQQCGKRIESANVPSSETGLAPSMATQSQNGNVRIGSIRPLGLTVIAAYGSVDAFLTLSGATTIMFGEGRMSMTYFILTVLLLLLACLNITVAYGLWVVAPWGRAIGQVWCSIAILLGLVGLFMVLVLGSGKIFILPIVPAGLHVWILTYLAKSEIKEIFRAA